VKRPTNFFSIGKGNRALGRGMWDWSIPPEPSCRGAMPVCENRCYGKREQFRKRKLKRCYIRNFAACKSRGFAAAMIAELQRGRPVGFRIDDIGDFFSVSYIAKWTRIVRVCRQVKFFAYTRAWRIAELWTELQKLSAEVNMVLVLSVDNASAAELSALQGADGLLRAWLAIDNSDIPTCPVDLVFRCDWQEMPPLENLDHFGARICPRETGRSMPTCRECTFCWKWKENR
jgi:hypothetical protein